ncbi:MAG: pitrilysin family protein [bacterium]
MKRPQVSRVSRITVLVAVLTLAALTLPAAPVAAGDIVDHPDKLKFEELKYDPPRPQDYRHTLKSGVTAYIAENRELPTFDLSILVRTGEIYDPLEKAGLARMAAHLMRNGGTRDMTAGEIDERVAFLAGEISIEMDATEAEVRLFCLSKDIDEGLDLLKRVLKAPVFDQETLDRYRADILSEMEQRNSSSRDIEVREWYYLMYGDNPQTMPYRQTEASINSITRDDLLAFHEKYFFPGNFIVAVSGDFETGEIISKLDAMFDGWPDRDLDLPRIPDEIPGPKPGVYMVDKEDVNQSRIRLGHIGVKRDIPDQYALLVMNDILGGGGFTSRIVRRVRSDEGLAYSAGCRFDRPVEYPGTFRAYFQTKHATAAFGTALIVEEIKRIRTEKCDLETVENSKAGFISDIVNPFSNKSMMVSTFADDDYTGRPDGYWQDYAGNMRAVTPDDVLAAAQKYLHPDKLVFLVVGDVEAVERGSDKHPERFSDFGEITVLPPRDPMTLEVE